MINLRSLVGIRAGQDMLLDIDVATGCLKAHTHELTTVGAVAIPAGWRNLKPTDIIKLAGRLGVGQEGKDFDRDTAVRAIETIVFLPPGSVAAAAAAE